MSTRRRLPMEKALLGFLMEGPMHGYDLHRRVEEDLGRIWYMGLSNVYSALNRLEEAGQVTSTLDSQESRPTRKVYHITPAGRKAFLDWVHQPVPAMKDMRVEFPAKLYFFRTLNLEHVEKLIAAQGEVCRERVKRLERNVAQCGAHDFDRLVFDFRRRQIEAILRWLAFCREEWDRWAHVPAAAEP
jgi:PadR family transcriptional regulator AphA